MGAGPTSSHTTTVAVIIPAYNEEANIARAVGQVLREPWHGSLALDAAIVVDDYSADGTFEIASALAQQDSRIRVMRNAQRSGKNAGIRAAATTCQADVTVVVDADMLLERGCLTTIVRRLSDDPTLMASSCLVEPLPARSLAERASCSQALLVAEFKRRGHAYLSAVYALRSPAVGALDVPDGVADDAYVTCWLRARGYRYAVCSETVAYIRAATGLRDFARQTLRGRYGEVATRLAIAAGALPRRGLRVLLAAVARACLRDPLGFVLYCVWYGIVLATPTKMWMPALSLSTFETVRSTKDVSPDAAA